MSASFQKKPKLYLQRKTHRTKKIFLKYKGGFILGFDLFKLIRNFFRNLLNGNSKKKEATAPDQINVDAAAADTTLAVWNRDSKKHESTAADTLTRTTLANLGNKSSTVFAAADDGKNPLNVSAAHSRSSHSENPSTDAVDFKQICPDSGKCLVFGIHVEQIKTFFDNFNFQYIVFNEIKQIGAKSINGIVMEIPFLKEKYKTYTVLKCPQTGRNADNLFYEAFVGFFVNKWNKMFPCFLETYKILDIAPTLLQRFVNKIKFNQDLNSVNFFTKMLTNFGTVNIENNISFLETVNINLSCEKHEEVCILIQHLKDSVTFKTFLENEMKKNKETFARFVQVELQYFFYQIYSCLGTLHNVFTHYDLHLDNVLVFDLTNSEDKYVKMIYHYNDETKITFYTRYLMKIIDYGLSYVPDSPKLLEEIKNKNTTCENNGIFQGYYFLNGHEDRVPYLNGQKDSHIYLNSSKRNISFDLKFAILVRDLLLEKLEKIKKREIIDLPFYQSIFIQLYYQESEDLRDYWKAFKHIHNVNDMHKALKNLLERSSEISENKNYFQQNGKKQIGEMNIYLNSDKPMEFTFTENMES
jgi:hypothetical protein